MPSIMSTTSTDSPGVFSTRTEAQTRSILEEQDLSALATKFEDATQEILCCYAGKHFKLPGGEAKRYMNKVAGDANFRIVYQEALKIAGNSLPTGAEPRDYAAYLVIKSTALAQQYIEQLYGEKDSGIVFARVESDADDQQFSASKPEEPCVALASMQRPSRPLVLVQSDSVSRLASRHAHIAGIMPNTEIARLKKIIRASILHDLPAYIEALYEDSRFSPQTSEFPGQPGSSLPISETNAKIMQNHGPDIHEKLVLLLLRLDQRDERVNPASARVSETMLNLATEIALRYFDITDYGMENSLHDHCSGNKNATDKHLSQSDARTAMTEAAMHRYWIRQKQNPNHDFALQLLYGYAGNEGEAYLRGNFEIEKISRPIRKRK